MVHNYPMPLFANAQLNFGYPWWLSYGHLPIAAGAVSLVLLGYARKWSRWPMLLLCLLALWSCSAFLVARFVLNINGRASLPTQSFLRSGVGRVLDMGAGTGRSSIMVLESRPQATLVALDLFGESFEHHFGPSDSPQQKLFDEPQGRGCGAARHHQDRRHAPASIRTCRVRCHRERLCHRSPRSTGDRSSTRRSRPCRETRRRFSRDSNRQGAVGSIRLRAANHARRHAWAGLVDHPPPASGFSGS